MLRIAICDDNQRFCENLGDLVQKILPQCTPLAFQISCFHRTKHFINALESETFQIVLLDIDLGDKIENGITLGKKINIKLPLCQIIFTTGYLDYISTVYEVQHAYFVFKSELEKYLPSAFMKVLDNMNDNRNHMLVIKRQGETICINQNDIIFLERELRITKIITTHGEQTTYQKLDELEKDLYGPSFIRCHRSYIVNLFYIKSMKKYMFTCENNIFIPISKSHYDTTVEVLCNYLGKSL